MSSDACRGMNAHVANTDQYKTSEYWVSKTYFWDNCMCVANTNRPDSKRARNRKKNVNTNKSVGVRNVDKKAKEGNQHKNSVKREQEDRKSKTKRSNYTPKPTARKSRRK